MKSHGFWMDQRAGVGGIQDIGRSCNTFHSCTHNYARCWSVEGKGWRRGNGGAPIKPMEPMEGCQRSGIQKLKNQNLSWASFLNL